VLVLLTDDCCQLWEAVITLGCHATSFNNAFTASQQQQIQAHGVTINVLLDHIQSTTFIDGSVVSKCGLKFHEPHGFDGKIKSVHPFLDKVESATWLQYQALVTDYDKALYLFSYLKDGSPKSWYYTIKNNPTHALLLQDWAAFLEAFHHHFKDLDCQFSTTEEMDELHQTESLTVLCHVCIVLP
jgi:hypothetical protein